MVYANISDLFGSYYMTFQSNIASALETSASTDTLTIGVAAFIFSKRVCLSLLPTHCEDAWLR